MFDWFMLHIMPAYITGIGYSVLGGVVVSLVFAIIRWHLCVRQYIQTGRLDDVDDSWFLGDNNWFHGSHQRDNYDYGNAPIVVAVDILTIVLLTTILSLAWPITIIATSVITYAMAARVRFARKKEFVDRLEGTHA